MNNKIHFVGDLILGDQPVLYGFGLNSIWQKAEYNGLFAGVKELLNDADYTIANFEAIIKKYSDNNMSVSEWAMCCPETVCKQLKEANINMVSVANNHTMDYGKKWFDYTISVLEKNGIGVLGKKDKPYIKIDCGTKKVGIVGCSYLTVKQKEDIGYLHNPNKKQWESIVKECGDCDQIIAYVHWGSEFVVNPTEKQEKISREIVEAGVDLIVGHHPHILQTNSIVQGKPVIYSLGNFVSDYWQKRLRKTEVATLFDNGEIKKTDCYINKVGQPEVTGQWYSDVEYLNNGRKEHVLWNRMRIRFEYLMKICGNFHRIKGKWTFLKWLLKRVYYVAFLSWKEIKNPEIIYEYYEK